MAKFEKKKGGMGQVSEDFVDHLFKDCDFSRAVWTNPTYILKKSFVVGGK